MKKNYEIYSTILAKGNFTHLSDNLEVLDSKDFGSEGYMTINNHIFDVVLVETNLDKDYLTIGLKIDIEAKSWLEAEYIANYILHNEDIDKINLLDIDAEQVHTVPLHDVKIDYAEYFVA